VLVNSYVRGKGVLTGNIAAAHASVDAGVTGYVGAHRSRALPGDHSRAARWCVRRPADDRDVEFAFGLDESSMALKLVCS
jgi:hypothetical protein